MRSELLTSNPDFRDIRPRFSDGLGNSSVFQMSDKNLQIFQILRGVRCGV